MKIGLLIAVALATLLTSCAPPVIEQTAVPIKDSGTVGRITVVESSSFVDAKYETRTIVILRDSKTGAEYLGVQGFGVMDMTRECTTTTDSDGDTTTTCKTVED